MLRSDPSVSTAAAGSGSGSGPGLHSPHATDNPASVPTTAAAPPGPPPPPQTSAPSSSKTRLNKFLLPFTEVFHLGSSSSSSHSHNAHSSSSSSARESPSPTSAAKHNGHQYHHEPTAAADQQAQHQHQLHSQSQQQQQQQQQQTKLRRAPSLVSRISRSSQLGQSFRSLFSSNKSASNSSSSSARLKNSASTQCLSSTVSPALVQPVSSPLGVTAPASSPLASIDETTPLPPATPTLAPRPLNKRWSAADLRAAAAAAPDDVDGLAHVIAPMVAAESSSTDHLPHEEGHALVMQQPAADSGTVIGPHAAVGPGASRGSRRSLASRPSVMDLFSAMSADAPSAAGQVQQQDYASAEAVVDLSRPIPVNVQRPIQAEATESSGSLGDALPLDMGGMDGNGPGALASGGESVGGGAGTEDKFFDAQSHLSATDVGDQQRPETPVVLASTPPPGMKAISTKPQRPTLGMSLALE
ncbi:hypothetical protein BCR44DRAFT_1224982 [Catenaria anguillulae PL171]|uniref:Uncharacterized protein n=1 Tax=Catenaria anguillulae PL171 TaxID=765915 RepID=A0A1Y2HE06_9FUNG|nr:hypothetical protein BCR44DRAFT_1224982 [Catenaria anguillulae PL171]